MDDFRLQILVPQYKETDEIIKPLLDSIELQIWIDLNWVSVIICNDGSDVKLSNELLTSYSFNIEYVQCDHKGVSATRNACLDRSIADYVMFCDADDKFTRNDALFRVMRLTRENPDMISFSFTQEVLNKNGEITYELHEHDGTFVHGKAFARKFLLNNNIRFDETLHICEDSNFIGLCMSIADKIIEDDHVIYVWTWRNGSVSHSDSNYDYVCYLCFVDSSSHLIDELIRRSMIQKASFRLAQSIIYSYYLLYVTVFTDTITKEEFSQAEEHLANAYKRFIYLWNDVSDNQKTKIVKFIYDGAISEELYAAELELIEEWVCDLAGQSK